MRTLCAVGVFAGGGCLCGSVSWEVLIGGGYFAAFTLVALLGLFYRDPTRDSGTQRQKGLGAT